MKFLLSEHKSVDNTILRDLFSALDIVVMERLENGAFRLIGQIPDWFSQLCPGAAGTRGQVRPERELLFFEHFVTDAEVFWRQRGSGQLRSGPWSENDQCGAECPLEAVAVCLGDRHILYIQRLGRRYRETRALLQRARENRLDYEALERTQKVLQRTEAELQKTLARLEKSHADLLSIFSRLRVGTVLLDAGGHLSFLSQACQRILGTEQDQVLGSHWTRVFPLSDNAQSQLQAMLQRPARERARISTDLETANGQHYWMELDIQDDPRDPKRKILFLYDLSEVQDLRRLLHEKTQWQGLVGSSEPMLSVYREIQDLARVDTTVLIEGETGTGKELAAREIHATSARKNQPFVALNCAGLTESLLASQLFGHKRGAFTGAVADHEGIFEAANGGTLFLDEIGDVSALVQTSLLRVLQEREIVRLGESKPRKINVRILVATNRNLQEAVAQGTFRADLFYRIRVARLHLPPLRERLQDLPLLVSAFLNQFHAAIGKPVQAVSQEAMALLHEYSWPGNVRELRSAVEFAIIRCRGTVIKPEDLPAEIGSAAESAPGHAIMPGDETQRLLTALEQSGGNRTAAARLLGMSRATFYRRLADLDIPRNS